MIRDAFKPAHELAPLVDERDETVGALEQPIPVRVYRPKDEEEPLPGILLIHGAVEGGAFDSRFVALARAMAIRGATVATPDLPSLRKFGLDAEDPARIAAIARWFSDRKDLVEDRAVALVGISVGGSYALVAASRPEVKERISMVLAFGAYANLYDLLVRWMTDPNPGVPELLDPQTEGRRLVLLGNVERLVSDQEQEFVEESIRRILYGRPEPTAPERLSPESERVLQVAASEGPVEPEVVDEMLAPLLPDLSALSPDGMAPCPECPIFLLHGTNDPIIGVEHFQALLKFLDESEADVEAHLTDVFSHVGRSGEKGSSFFEAWPLLSFLADAMSQAGL
jgi:acetyl esterase/lipase